MESQLLMSTDNEIQVDIMGIPGKVIMQFSEPVMVMEYTPQQAREIAQILLKMADDAERAGIINEKELSNKN